MAFWDVAEKREQGRRLWACSILRFSFCGLYSSVRSTPFYYCQPCHYMPTPILCLYHHPSQLPHTREFILVPVGRTRLPYLHTRLPSHRPAPTHPHPFPLPSPLPPPACLPSTCLHHLPPFYFYPTHHLCPAPLPAVPCLPAGFFLLPPPVCNPLPFPYYYLLFYTPFFLPYLTIFFDIISRSGSFWWFCWFVVVGTFLGFETGWLGHSHVQFGFYFGLCIFTLWQHGTLGLLPPPSPLIHSLYMCCAVGFPTPHTHLPQFPTQTYTLQQLLLFISGSKTKQKEFIQAFLLPFGMAHEHYILPIFSQFFFYCGLTFSLVPSF